MFNILEYFFPSLYIQFSNTFYIGRKRIPISLKKNREGYVVKFGSGFASYTLETNKNELEGLSEFVKNFIASNP